MQCSIVLKYGVLVPCCVLLKCCVVLTRCVVLTWCVVLTCCVVLKFAQRKLYYRPLQPSSGRCSRARRLCLIGPVALAAGILEIPITASLAHVIFAPLGGVVVAAAAASVLPGRAGRGSASRATCDVRLPALLLQLLARSFGCLAATCRVRVGLPPCTPRRPAAAFVARTCGCAMPLLLLLLPLFHSLEALHNLAELLEQSLALPTQRRGACKRHIVLNDASSNKASCTKIQGPP